VEVLACGEEKAVTALRDWLWQGPQLRPSERRSPRYAAPPGFPRFPDRVKAAYKNFRKALELSTGLCAVSADTFMAGWVQNLGKNPSTYIQPTDNDIKF
jgi:hypothetical protein